MTIRVWLLLLGGHVTWSLHLLASYFLADLACISGDGWLWAIRNLATLVAAAVTAALIAIAWRQRSRSSRGHAHQAGEEPAEEYRFLARVALVLSGVFLLAIVWAGSTNFFLAPCV
jgi:hypothetical protein